MMFSYDFVPAKDAKMDTKSAQAILNAFGVDFLKHMLRGYGKKLKDFPELKLPKKKKSKHSKAKRK